MKRLFSILAIVIFFAFPLTLHADIISGNHFFYNHPEKIKNIVERYDGKEFIINSPSGYVVPRDEPGSKKGIPSYFEDHNMDNVYVFKNGEICAIEVVYFHRGKYWGVMSSSHTYQPPGWVLMDELLMTYERDDFEIENKDNFYEYTGGFDAVLSAKKLVMWQWPGSDKEKYIVDIKTTSDIINNTVYAYKDSEGREWVRTNYIGGWICISDPENNSNIPSFFAAPEPVIWSYDGNRDWTKEAEVFPSAEPTKLPRAADVFQQPSDSSEFFSFDNPTFSIIIIFTSALTVTVVTIGLLLRVKRKKVKKDGD